MTRVSSWAVLRPWRALAIWLLAVLAVVGLATVARGEYVDSFSLPDTDSSRAQTILSEKFPAASGASAYVVFSSPDGVTDPAIKREVESLLRTVDGLPSVSSVGSPYAGPPGGGNPQISQDGSVAYATLQFDRPAQDVAVAEVESLVGAVEDARAENLSVGASGQVIQFATGEPPSSEAIGIGVALIILVLAFGSLVATVLPVITAVIGLGLGLALTTTAASLADISSFSPTIAAMIGLGVGIDYALFVVNRYRQGLRARLTPREAALEAVGSAGRAVLFAGGTVIIALLGLLVLGISFTNGLAVAGALTVSMVMASALFFLPAVLSLLGQRTFSLRLPWARKLGGRTADSATGQLDVSAWGRLAAAIQRRPKAVVLGVLVMVGLLAFPATDLRLGSADDGGRAVGSIERTAYDLLSDGFGVGFNGPLLVAVDTDSAGLKAVGDRIGAALAGDPGVAQVSPAIPSPARDAVLFTVYPTTSPQDTATFDTLERLRDTVLPAATEGTGARAHVGGAAASNVDFTAVLADALPVFLLLVVGLGIVMLIGLFRSLVIPVTAAVTSVLSFLAGMGAVVAVFQWGWLGSVLGVEATGPIEAFLPIMLFAILFGLSMDYQVFLVSRMQEEWERQTGARDNAVAVRRGVAGSGRVVLLAGAIMASVFAAFVISDDRTTKLFGLALAVSVVVDALLIRLILIPAAMTLFGRANWWLPSALSRRLRSISIEGPHPGSVGPPAPEPVSVSGPPDR